MATDNDEVLHEMAARFMVKNKDINSNVDNLLSTNILSLFHISDSSDSSLSLTVSIRDRTREGDDSWSTLTSETETESESILEEEEEFIDDAELNSDTEKVKSRNASEPKDTLGSESEDRGEAKKLHKKKKKSKKLAVDDADDEGGRDLKSKLKKKKKRHLSATLIGSLGSPASSGQSIHTRATGGIRDVEQQLDPIEEEGSQQQSKPRSIVEIKVEEAT